MPIDLALHHLRAIVALADHGTFTAAAAALQVAQSSLSRSIQESERRLRVPLFLRTTRRVTLTPDGEAIVAVARSLVANVDTGLEHMAGYLAGTRGSLRIATLPSLAATLLPPFLLALRSSYPTMHIHVADSLNEQVWAAVGKGRADVAITALSGPVPRGYEIRPLAEDDFFVAVPGTHPWAGEPKLRWSQLADVPLVSFSPASSIQPLVRQALDNHRAIPEEEVAAQNIGAVGGLVAGGLGLGVVPGFVLPLLDFAGLTFIPLRPRVSRKIVLVRSRDRPLTPVAHAWVDIVTGPHRPDLRGVRWQG
ncbi:LysR family transcriptional regulator [Janibacter cremeus]|uniref:DNA-binding transcriptional LysR family regulator n=1 Tax=Janibacter cremeus TaxID=1285192 RepID=A0A852VYG0_9MICO|nr:LysR family transcriptional regulator [Janibacter cremeus]NYF99683.1 DNA-binding transcriptional LysR family regulator [Janibacter cremeus]